LLHITFGLALSSAIRLVSCPTNELANARAIFGLNEAAVPVLFRWKSLEGNDYGDCEADA